MAAQSDSDQQLVQDTKAKIMVMYSADSAVDIDGKELEQEDLNGINLSGLPRHKMELQEGTIVKALFASPSNNITKGTRLRIIGIKRDVLTTVILTGLAKNSVFSVRRMILTTKPGDLPFQLKRYQFPVQICPQ